MSTDPQPVRAAQARMRHQAAGYADCPYTADDIAADGDCLVCGEPGDRHAPEDDS